MNAKKIKLVSHALSLIKAAKALLKDDFVLAQKEEVDYFRKLYLKSKERLKEPLPKPEQSAPRLVLDLAPPPQEKGPPPLKTSLQPLPSSMPPEEKKAAPLVQSGVKEKGALFSIPRTETLEPIPSKRISPFKALLAKIAPHIPVLDEPPSDLDAKKIKDRWKTKNLIAPISILSLSEPPEQKALLEKIQIALDVYFGPAKLVLCEPIEKEKQWETFLSSKELKIVIACDYTLWQLRSAMGFYKENPIAGTRTLGNIPLFLLPDLSLYLKDPLLKRSLWKALCQKLSS